MINAVLKDLNSTLRAHIIILLQVISKQQAIIKKQSND